MILCNACKVPIGTDEHVGVTGGRERPSVADNRCRCRLKCNGGILEQRSDLSLELDPVSIVAIVASVVDRVVSDPQAGLILDLALDVCDRLDNGRYFRIEIGLVLPDFLR